MWRLYADPEMAPLGRSLTQQQGQNEEAQRLQQSELARLRRELARVEEENAFLKKAAAYFAKQPK